MMMPERAVENGESRCGIESIESRAGAGWSRVGVDCAGIDAVWCEASPVPNRERGVRVHYDQKAIQDAAEDAGSGWRKTVLTLGADDTAYSGVSTKYHFGGPAEITYLIHPSGWTVQEPENARRVPI